MDRIVQPALFNQYRNINIENNIKIIDAAIQDIVSYYEKNFSPEEPDTSKFSKIILIKISEFEEKSMFFIEGMNVFHITTDY